MSIEAYLDPTSAPSERPRLDDMHPGTVALHRAIDSATRRAGTGYLHPEGETLQVDLLGSPNMVAWQEAKAQLIFLGEQCWSALPQVYARYGTRTTTALLKKVQELENAAGAILTDCGMQACALLFDLLLDRGSHAIMTRQVYNKTHKYLGWVCKRVGGSFDLVDDDDPATLKVALRPETRIIFAETYTNPLMRAVDPLRLGQFALQSRKRTSPQLRLIIDNTIATPWALTKPLLDYGGVDFVVASGTKALGGEDRDLWGYIASNHVDSLNELMDVQAMRGGILDWRRATAILEGLPRARERFARRCASAARVAAFLDRHKRVSETYHPSLENHPDREVIQREYQLGGSLLSFRVAGANEDETRHFCDVLATCVVLRYALSFDGLSTKVNHHATVSEYFTPVEELERARIDRLVRLGIGVEEPEDIIACLNWALWHHQKISTAELEGWRRERARDLYRAT